jgi:chemotaxis protein histidine kinase CheA
MAQKTSSIYFECEVEMLGGIFMIESSPGKGTTIKAEVPCYA